MQCAWGADDTFYPLSRWQVHELLDFSSTEAVLLPGKHAPHFETPGIQAVADLLNGIGSQGASCHDVRRDTERDTVAAPAVVFTGFVLETLLAFAFTCTGADCDRARARRGASTAGFGFWTSAALATFRLQSSRH